MTSATLSRSSSTYTSKSHAASWKAGNNPSRLTLRADAAAQRDGYFKFPLPAVLLDPTTVISTAYIMVKNDGAWPGSHTLSLARCTETWSPTTLTYGAGTHPNTTATVSLTKVGAADGTSWDFDVKAHLVSMQAGAKNYGWRLRTNNGSTRYITNTMGDSGSFPGDMPMLQVVFYAAPGTPNAASPTDGQVVSQPKPLLRLAPSGRDWNFDTGPGGGGVTPDPDVASVQFQIDRPGIGIWDSGTLTATEVELDTNLIPGAPTHVAGVTALWRGRYTTIVGAVSPWSDWVEFSYEPLGTVEMTVPPDAPDNTVSDPTPPFGWVTTGLDQVRYRLTVEDPALPTNAPPLWDSGLRTSTDDTDSPDRAVLTELGKTYRGRIRVWDDFNRVPSHGMPEFAEDTKDFTFVLSASVDPVTDLLAVDLDPYPYFKITWTDSDPADQYQIDRDGVGVAVVDAVDVIEGGTAYGWIDYLAAPRTPHRWTVRRIVNGVTSSGNPQTALVINEPAGIWLSDPANDTYLPIITIDSQKVNLSEDGAPYRVLNARYGVYIRSTLYGWEGEIVGELVMTPLSGDEHGQSLRNRFLALRERPLADPLILTLADMTIACNAYDMNVSPTPHPGKNGDYVYTCSFSFIEVKAG